MNDLFIKLTHLNDQYDAFIRDAFLEFGCNYDHDIMLVDKYQLSELQPIINCESKKKMPRVRFANYIPDGNIAIFIKDEDLKKFEMFLS